MQTRFAEIKGARKTETGTDLVVDLSIASQAARVERWYGIEILEVSPKAVRVATLNDGASVLFNHDWNDLRGTHVAGSVRADSDKVLRGQVRLTSATQAGRDAIALVEGGHLSKVSTGYRIHKVVERSKKRDGSSSERELDGEAFERLLEAHGETRDAGAFRRALDSRFGGFERTDDELPEYTVTDWEPYESSLVTVPADRSVGVGRMPTLPPSLSPAESPATSGVAKMAETNAAAGNSADTNTQHQAAGQGEQRSAPVDGQRAVDLERNRRRGIENLCKANKIDDNIRDHWIGTGLSVEAITDDLLTILEERGKSNPQSDAKLGLSAGEVKRYNLMAAIRATAEKNWTNAGFELECSRAIGQRLQRMPDPNRFFVPFEVQGARAPGARRDLSVASGGGELVGTDNMSFIEVLRNRSVAYRMGARRLSGLVGSVTVPRQTGQATPVWLSSETATVTESAQTFSQMALSPKTVGAYTEISRQLMLQSSPDAESIVTADLGAVAALAVDVGVLRGSGASGEPTGIVTTSGIGTVTGTSFDYAKVLEFQSDVASANVVPAAGGYVTTPAVAVLAMTRTRFSNTDTPLWDGNLWDGRMAGFQAMSSNQMAAGTMLFGDWSQVVVGEWGVLEVEVNPFANFQAGIIGIRALVSIDVGLRYAAAFSYGAAMT
jgi:HK97 family phage major capsid protein